MAISVVKVGTEQKVNQTIDNQQTDSSITALTGGGWVVTWTSLGQDGSGYGIYQRKYNADGSTAGADIQVGTTSAGDQTLPNVTALADGGWVVTWTSSGQDGSGLGVYQRRYGASGDATPEVKVNSTTAGDQSKSVVAGLAGGGWIVAWEAPDASSSGIFYRKYDNAGATSGTDIAVNATTTSTQINVSVAALKVTGPGDPASGGFVITWQSLNQDGGGYGIYQQLYSAAGAAVGGEVKVNTTTTGDQSTPSVTGLADGGWVVTWTSFGQDGALGGIYQQRYDKSGGTVGGETLVNVVTAGAQSEPAVTALSDGGWVVTWTSNVGPDGSLNGIYQRHYGSDGTAGPQLLVNATTPQDQTAPTVTATADGGWIVAWTSQGQDGSGSGIYQRRYAGGGNQLSVDQDYATGSALDEVLNVATGTLNANDVLDGGAGIDTIQYSGTLDWTVGASVTNFEALKGGSGDDTLTITATQLSMLGLSIDGGAGTGDKIQVTGGGSLDLSNKTITNVEAIELTSSAGTAVTVNAANKNLALLLKGNASANDQVTLQGGTFKQAELAQLIQNGINTIVDDNGTFVNQAPTDLSLAGNTVAENAANGTLVSAVKVTDPTPGDKHTFTLTNDAGGRFEMVGDELRVKNGALLNYEAASLYVVTVKATDAGGNSVSKDFTISLTNVNEAPTDIGLVGTTVAENAANGTQVGSLSTTDPDTGETFKYALVDNAGGRFDVQGGKIIVANGALLDFEGQKSHVIVVEVTDKGGTGLSFQKQFTITLTNENEAPTSVTLNGAGTVVENAPDNLVVGTLTGADPDGNNTLTFSLADDAGGRFKIVGNQLQVANGKLLDFEGGQLEHTVKVRATDPGGLFVEKAFTFTVTNANEAPTALDLLGSFVAQQAESGTLVGTLSATDPDAGEANFTYTLLDNAGGRFAIEDGKLVVADGSKLNASVATMHTVTIQVADAAGLTFQNDFIINVGATNHAPSNLTLSGDMTVAEDAAGGTVIGTLSSADQDAPFGDVVSFSLVDDDGGLFEIVDGKLVVADGAVLDFEKNESHVVEIVASDTSGESITQSFMIGVKNVNEAPTDVALSAATVVGKPAADALVGTLTGTDPDAGDTLTFTLTDNAGGRFKIGANNQLLVANPALFDGAAGTYAVKVKATDAGGLSRVETFTITVNSAPTGVTPTAFTLAEAAPANTLVGTLAGIDPDLGDTFTYTLTDDAGGRFKLGANGQLLVANGALLDFEAAAAHTVTVKVTDAAGASTDQQVTVNLTDVNERPTNVALSNLSVRELSGTGTLVGTLSATDPDKGETFTYKLLDDAGGRFQIVGNQLQVKNGVALDFEQSGPFKAPSVKVLVTDTGGLTLEKTFALTVTNWTTEVTPGSGFDDVIIGDRGKDRLGGGAGNDRLEGATANDTLSGGAGHDLLKGGQGKDTLAGGVGNDRLWGGLGKDVLSGNTGKDVFVFDTKLSKSSNVDTLKDYNVRDDSVWLENKIFTKIGRAGSEKKPVKLSSDAFHVGKAAADAEDRIVYDKATGALFYDRDGSGAAAAVQFATLKKGLGLTHHDFFVI